MARNRASSNPPGIVCAGLAKTFDDGTIIQVHTRFNRSSSSVATRLQAMGASLPEAAFREDRDPEFVGR